MRRRIALIGAWLWLCAPLTYASVYGTIRGVVHDTQHRPVGGVSVSVKARVSDWSRTAQTDSEGEFLLVGVPAGRYHVTVSRQGFGPIEQDIEVQSDSSPVLHFALKVAAPDQTVEVSAAPEWINPGSASTESIVSRDEITRTPGASRTNSLAMITDLTPGATMVHDQLHIRGGHQVSWLVDGIPVPNMNIADNVGPLFDPHDIDYLEVHRGGLAAEYGDRTYGVLNIVPRSGFERDNEAELTLGYGSGNETNDHFSLGSHTQRFAYYVGLTGNRTDFGLQPPSMQSLHDLSSSFSGFSSLLYNPDSADQFRLVGSVRQDHYQVPNTPEQQDSGIRDTQREHDAFLNVSWMRVLGPGVTLTVAPFLHLNHAAYDGGPGDTPVIANDRHDSTYAGGEASVAMVSRRHNLRAGFSSWGENEKSFLGLNSPMASGPAFRQTQSLWGDVEAFYLEDQYRATSWFTMTGGVRLTRFTGSVAETAASPRAGAALRLPGLNWVLRGFYGRYYQPPPLTTASGPLLALALGQGFGFLPLHGERDEQREVGLAIPFHGWAIDLSHYHTNARNFFDHTPLGNSNLFFPVTIAGARLRGWEAAVRSPRLFRDTHLRLAYAHQYAQGTGDVTGGLTDFSPPETGFFYLDHDQRNTVTGGFETGLPWRTWLSGNVSAGSGFLDGDGPAHLPGHSSVDLSIGRSFGERLSVSVTALNLANQRFLLDNSNTFGGTHYNFPRQVLVSLTYRFHY